MIYRPLRGTVVPGRIRYQVVKEVDGNAVVRYVTVEQRISSEILDRGLTMHGLSIRGWFLIITLAWGGNSMAEPAEALQDKSNQSTPLQSQLSAVASSSNYLGDLNLDGIPCSIVDLVMSTLFSCIVDPGPWPPLDVQEQADEDCDGVVTIGDVFRPLGVLLGEEPLYSCPTANVSSVAPPSRIENATGSGNYVVEIRCPSLVGSDTAWVDVVLLSAPEVLTGFQFSIEYDPNRLEFLSGSLGDEFADWAPSPGWFSKDTISESGSSCLRIVGMHCVPGRQCVEEISMPDLPMGLARLKFHVRTPSEDFETPLNFAWDNCRDNGIAVGPESGVCGWWPYYLAISNNVYSASGDDITGAPGRYGGAGDDCLVGGSRSTPVRQIDFRSDVLSYYQRSCCVGRIGDANGSGEDMPTIGDISVMIDAKFITGTCEGTISCLTEADANQSGGVFPTCGDITIGDIAMLIDDVFITGEPPFVRNACLE